MLSRWESVWGLTHNESTRCKVGPHTGPSLGASVGASVGVSEGRWERRLWERVCVRWVESWYTHACTVDMSEHSQSHVHAKSSGKMLKPALFDDFSHSTKDQNNVSCAMPECLVKNWIFL